MPGILYDPPSGGATPGEIQAAVNAYLTANPPGIPTATQIVFSPNPDNNLVGLNNLQALVNDVDERNLVVSTDDTINDVRRVTQAQYNALTPPNSTTLYMVVG
jgi:hypothetical protein